MNTATRNRTVDKPRLHGLFNIAGNDADSPADVALCNRVMEIVAATSDVKWQEAAASRLNLYRRDADWFAQAADFVASPEAKMRLTRFIGDIDGMYIEHNATLQPDLAAVLAEVATESYGRQTVLFQTLVLEYLAAKGWESLAPQGMQNGRHLKN